MQIKKIIIAITVAVCVVAAGIVYILPKKDTTARVVETESPVKEEYTSEVSATDEAETIYVYVCGQVASPGIVSLPSGARVYEAVAAAGGMTKEADVDAINQAELISDGQMIYIPYEGEEVTIQGSSLQSGGLVNINTAGVSELTTLPGIGESRANDIIKYRENNGKFSTIEDIMNVSGIKEAAFNRIKDYIKV